LLFVVADVVAVGNKVYVIGGKTLDPPTIFSNVWCLDLTTLVWTLVFSLPTTTDSEIVVPEPRYFHTASNYRNESIIIFGGLSPEDGTGERCLDDIIVFDLTKREWRIPVTEGMEVPRKRYAHVATISRDRLVIAGGESRYHGMKSTPENLLDLHVYDIPTGSWVYNRTFGTEEDHIGYYRSVMATSAYTPPTYPLDNKEEEDRLLDAADVLYQQIPASKLSSEPSSPTTSFRSRSGSLETTNVSEERRSSSRPDTGNAVAIRGNLNAIPETDTNDSEPYVYVYSTRQRSARDLSRLIYKIHSPQNENFAVEDHTESLPPRSGNIPLKFPYGDIIGDWLMYCGTIPNQKPMDVPGRARSPTALKPASFHILALHLPTLQFKTIETGSVFLTGSWNRGVVWANRNTFVVFGNVGSDMNTDYAMRRSNFNHIVMIDLEVFGIYKPCKITSSRFSRDFAVNMLSRKEFSDMDVVTKENSRIPVNSRILSHRWPMFTEVLNTCIYGTPYAGEAAARRPSVASLSLAPPNQHPLLPISERPRVLYLPLRHDHSIAFLTYIYTDALPIGADVSTLCALLVLSKRLAPGLERLAMLVTDVLHERLNDDNAWQIIEAAAFSGRTGLQIQAMLVMRTAADLKIQAQRKREELRRQQTLPALPAPANGSVVGSVVGSAVGSVGSVQNSDASSIVPTA
jgi:leucine-zipper-like transcriptional regulator 1